MIVYSFHDEDYDRGGDGTTYFASLGEARRELRKHLAQGREEDDLHMGFGEAGSTLEEVEIHRLDIGKIDRATVLAILNDGGFVEGREVVEVWQATTCGDCEQCEAVVDPATARGCTKKKVRRIR